MYNILCLLLPFLAAYTHISSSIASPVTPTLQLPSPGAFNDTLSSNSSVPTEVSSQNAFHVPQSDVSLHFHFGFPRHPLDPEQLGRLLTTVNWMAADLIFENGPHNSVPRRGPNRRNAFFFSMGFIDLTIDHTPTHTLSWGELSDIIRGLGIFLWEYDRPYRTKFEAMSDIYDGRIGTGWVKEAGKQVTES